MLQLVRRERRGAGSRRELCGLEQALNITKGCAFRWKAKEAGLQGMGRFLKIKSLNFERTLGLALSTGSSCQWREIWNCLPFGPKMEHWSSCDWFKWQVWFCKASLGGKGWRSFCSPPAYPDLGLGDILQVLSLAISASCHRPYYIITPSPHSQLPFVW